jgi:hypothetical protein
MRQNAGRIRAFAEFKRLISVINYQDFMLTPLTSCLAQRRFQEICQTLISPSEKHSLFVLAHTCFGIPFSDE